MESCDRNTWKKASAMGLAFTILCLIVCIIQFYSDPKADTFQKGVRIAINFLAVNFFFFLYFNPLSFRTYSILFYLYGLGNLLDDGNILGAICIASAFIFFSASGFLKNRRKLKIGCLLVLPAGCIVAQFFHTGLVTMILSVMNILGALYLFYLAWLILIPKVKKAYSMKSEKIISREKFRERDIEFLEHVLNGEKYSKIATLYDISESSVKAQMIELYHHLGVNSRTEFLAFCSGCTFILGDPDQPSAD